MPKQRKIKNEPVKRYVPWASKSEWCEVRLSLFSDSIEKQEWALGQITAWRCKTHPNIPLGIETTAALISARLQKMKQNDKGGDNLRMVYGMAIVRFVNFVAQLGQNNKHDMAIQSAVEPFNIPSWIVDLRHCTAHSTLPSFSLLDNGVNFALQWLQENYWSQIKIQDITRSKKIISNHEKDQMEINKLFNNLQLFQYECIYRENLSAQTHKKAILAKLKKLCPQNIEFTIDFLSQSNHLIMKQGEFNSILQDKKMCSSDLPFEIVKFCLPIIKIVFYCGEIESFLEKLISNADKRVHDSFQVKLIYSWAILIIRLLTSSHKPDDPIAEFLNVKKYYRYRINWPRIVKVLIKIPSKEIEDLLPKTLLSSDYLALDMSQANYIMKLFAIFNGYLVSEDIEKLENCSINRSFDLADFNFLNEDQNENASKKELNMKWELSEEGIDWAELPIGALCSTQSSKTLEIDRNSPIDDVMDSVNDFKENLLDVNINSIVKKLDLIYE